MKELVVSGRCVWCALEGGETGLNRVEWSFCAVFLIEVIMSEGRELSSLNRLLQWSVKETAAGGSEGDPKPIDREKIEQNREILDLVFMDEYKNIEVLRGTVASPGEGEEGVGRRIEALEALEEYAHDLDYAVNFGKVGVIKTLVEVYDEENLDEKVKMMVVWVLGTIMQDAQGVKAEVVTLNGVPVIAKALRDPSAKVRAKAVMASSALLRESPMFLEVFTTSGALKELINCLTDVDELPRRRAIFFLEHCRSTKAEYYADIVCKHRELIGKLLDYAVDENDEGAARALSAAVATNPDGIANLLANHAEDRVAEASRRAKTDPDQKRALLEILVKLKKPSQN